MSAIGQLLSPANLAVAHLVLSALVLLWNIVMAGRIATRHDTPPVLGALSAIGGLLVAPAVFIVWASGSLLAGRALYTIAWAWPLTAWIIAAQAIAALVLRRTAFPIGFAIAAYDVLLAVIYTLRFLVYQGDTVNDTVLGLAAAQAGALSVTAHPLAILLPYYIHVPILAPASPGRRGMGTVLRSAVAMVAGGWAATIAGAVLLSTQAVRSYAMFDGERLTERDKNEFTVGLKLFPTLSGAPSMLALSSDAALADSIGVGAVSVYITPDGAQGRALDSLARALEPVRAERLLVVALDLASGSGPQEGTRVEQYLASRVQDVGRVVRRLRPDIVVPVVDPYGAARRKLGVISEADWKQYLTRSADAARGANPRTSVLAHVGGFTPQDSVLFAWAVTSGTPIAGAAITLRPWYSGATALRGRMDAADRWMQATPPAKPVWVLEAGGFPTVHGDASLSRTLLGALAWATRRPTVRGVIVYEASDYQARMGLRAPGGRIRPAATSLSRAVRALGESSGS
ncbi:MAG TPA: hypothetical protein VJ672_14760 [Gemmatimonadaceae bacterium]|nr:hypothetical protein [Gemmatimonadaceae bacterium]